MVARTGMKRSLLAFFALAVGLSPLCAQDRVVLTAVAGSADAIAGEAVLREAYSQIDIDVDIRWLEADEGLAASAAGAFDGSLQRIGGITERYPHLIEVPIPINYLQAVALSTDPSITIDGWASLRPYRVGLVRGILFIEEGLSVGERVYAEDYSDLLAQLRAGVTDVAIAPRVNSWEARHGPEGLGVVELPGVLQTVALYHYLHDSNEALVPLIQYVLRNMIQDATIWRIREEAYRNLLGPEFEIFPSSVAPAASEVERSEAFPEQIGLRQIDRDPVKSHVVVKWPRNFPFIHQHRGDLVLKIFSDTGQPGLYRNAVAT